MSTRASGRRSKSANRKSTSSTSESVLLLLSAGKLQATKRPPAKFTLIQATAAGQVVGGSDFVLKTAG